VLSELSFSSSLRFVGSIKQIYDIEQAFVNGGFLLFKKTVENHWFNKKIRTVFNFPACLFPNKNCFRN